MFLPTRIYLSGGGICAMAHVGALKELRKHMTFKTVKEWMGVSAGALVAMCLCIGFTLEELEHFSVKFDFENIKEYDTIPGWILHFGIDTGERLHKLVNACLHVKGISEDITFSECLIKFGKNLRVLATDLNSAELRTFSATETPNYRISDAVRASMSYPYYFQPFRCPETSHFLSDGGIVSNYPLFTLTEWERNRTLSILIRSTVNKILDIDEIPLENAIMRPIAIVLNERTGIEAKLYNSPCIHIMLDTQNILDFALEEDKKEIIIKKGIEAVNSYLKHHPRPQRRYSVS
jgi:predicted acylesterase/phospholipase RssA